MTSSSCIELEQEKRMSKTRFNSHNYKPFTDFSIESIIGLEHNDSNKKRSTNNGDDVDVDVDVESMSSVAPVVKLEREVVDEREKNCIITTRKYRPKNFQCPACKMAFSNNGQLKNHVRIHTGERPFKCNYVDCNKTFTRNEELTRHKLIHTGVRPHSCYSCGKRFGRKDHLKKHVRTHDRKKHKRRLMPTSGPMQATSTSKSSIRTKSQYKINSINTFDDKFCVPLESSKRLNKKSQQQQPPPPQTTIILEDKLKRSDIVPVTSSAQKQKQKHSNFYHKQKIVSPQITEQTHLKLLNPLLTGTTPIPTANAIQQFTSDYWNKWYNFIGLCQQQHLTQPQPQPQLQQPVRETQLHSSSQLNLFQGKNFR